MYTSQFAILGVLLTICFIGYLCAQNVASTVYIPSETTIQRLPPVEMAPAYPPYGYQWSETPAYTTMPAPVPAPALNAPTIVPLPAPEVSSDSPEQEKPAESAEKVPPPPDGKAPEKADGEEKGKEEKEKKDEKASDEETESGKSTGPLGLITLDEELAWVNEVRPDSLLVRTTRYLSRYVGEWDGSVQLGIDGTSGSSETFNATFGVDGKRKFEVGTFRFDLDYKRNTSDGVTTADRLFFTCRYEHPYGDERWHFFAQDEVTYDEFQPWNVQVAVSSGIGHYLWKTETTELQGLWGGGFSQDIGGPDEEYVPEMHFGVSGHHQINKRQKLTGSCDYYPDISDFSQSRIINKASWEVLLDEEVNLSMTFNVTDRIYCPNPGGEENDLDYSILLMWKF